MIEDNDKNEYLCIMKGRKSCKKDCFVTGLLPDTYNTPFYFIDMQFVEYIK